MPIEEAAGCLAEGCLDFLFFGVLEFIFPAYGRKRRAQKAGEDAKPVPWWARALSLAIWAVVLTAIVVAVWFVLFWGNSG